MREHVTIKDLAKKLNISVSTVSKAFNEKYFDIKADTRKLILETAEEMDYRPNPIARKLLKRRTYNIGIIVPEFLNSFFPRVVFSMQEKLVKEGYQMLIMPSNERFETELENIKTLENNMVDGLAISLSKETKNVDYINRLIKRGMPIVLFNRVSQSINAPKVIFDDFKWAFFATEHLISQGYKDIYHFALPFHLSLCQKRIKGFKQALSKHNIPYDDTHIVEAGISIEDGERAINTLLNNGTLPEAIFAAGDKIAVGAMKALKKRGIKIPDQVGIVGFTESSLAEVVEPNLTSVDQPTTEIGHTTIDLLLQAIDNHKVENKEFIIDGKLNIRESSLRSRRV